MTINADKKKKLAELLVKSRIAAAGEGTSNAPPPTTSAPYSTEPTPIDKRKGVVVETGSEGEETGSDLVFKRHRSDDVVAPSHSASGGHSYFHGQSSKRLFPSRPCRD